MSTITVYSTPACQQCKATVRALTSAGIHHEVVDLTTHSAALQWVTEDLGYSQAPVVVVDDEHHWSGFRPDLIGRLRTRT